MNTNDPWKRLADSARTRIQSRSVEQDEMPFGCDTRVLACLRVPRSGTGEVWARLAPRALPLGAAALVLCWVTLPARTVTDPPAPDVVEQLMQEVLTP
jgi:hypothetical protein